MVFLNWIYAQFTAATIVLTLCWVSAGQARDCQFTLTEDSGKFQTPDFPKKYPNDIECIWNIQVQAGRFVLLSFGVFELESYNEQCIDLIEVKDGGRSTDELLGSFCDTSPPPKVITSSTNSLRVWFYSDKTDAYQGFNASYTSQWEQGCGGPLSKNTGRISSPRFPDYPYPNSMQCDWTISVPRGKFIRLEFSDFEVEFNCDSKCWCADRLELWDGPAFNETKLGSFCSSVQPLPVVSKSNRMRLRFVTNKEGRFKGFALSYTTSITPGCGGDFAGEQGVITSPNYPVSFPAFSDCVWRIRAPADRYISLRFEEFTGIDGTNSECSVDSVEVRDGYSRKAQILERYCIQNFPSVIVTKGHELYIHFRARSEAKATSQSYRRFKGIYLTHSTECNESIGLADGRIKNSQLSASSYFTLQLGQGQLYMAPQYGRVGSATVYAWCSQIQVLNKIVGEYLQIDLLNLTEVTAIATQGYQLPSVSYWGYVTSYKVEYTYDGNRWITYMDSAENSTRLSYTEFAGNKNINDIEKNVLEPSIIAKRIRIFPTGYQSNPVQHMCLRAELYGCTRDLGCGGVVSFEKPGKISVRGSDLQPTRCTWLFIPNTSSSSSDVVSFHFTYFDVPCHHGHVILHARNGGKKETFCGADPPSVTSLPSSSQIMVGIQLEKGAVVWGFDLKHKTESLGCGSIVQVSSSSTLTSPRYPLPYEHNQHCTWILTAHPGSKIAVTFLEFDLQPPNDTHCHDFVQIQDGRQDSSPVLERFCGKHVSVRVTSSFNNLRITFHSDNTTTAKGFQLQYNAITPKQYQPTSRHSEETENTEASAATASTLEDRNAGYSTHASSCRLIHLSLLAGLIQLFL